MTAIISRQHASNNRHAGTHALSRGGAFRQTSAVITNINIIASRAFLTRTNRAINTADNTGQQHDFNLRYLSPYIEQVRPQAKSLGLDDAWVYGLMRQESRFITTAKSVVGASGLMQLMPATAKWVAKKIGIADYNHGRVNDLETNVTLGTNYLKIVLDELYSHQALASAAYNAGPGRPRRWRDVRPMEAAVFAESIPFNETRDYV